MARLEAKAPPARQRGRRRHDDESTVIMEEIETIEKKELTPSERDVLAADKARMKRLGGGAHLDEWLEFQPGLYIRRRLAMRLAHSNKPEGNAYNQYYGQMLRAMGVDTDDKRLLNTLGAVVWLGDEPERVTILREIREAMTPGQRSRLNSPISARQRVEAELKARAAKAEAPASNEPSVSKEDRLANALRQVSTLVATIEEKNKEIAELKETLDATVTLANFKQDVAAVAARKIAAGDISPNYLTELADHLLDAAKRKTKAKTKP
jgi:hypothetical protein